MNGSSYIKVYPNAMSDDLCDRLVAVYRDCPEVLTTGETVGGLYRGKKSIDVLFSDLFDLYPELDGTMREAELALRSAAQKYVDEMPMFHDVTKFGLIEDTPKLKRYLKGIGKYDTHIDSSPMMPNRQVVVLAYLNDVTIGGHTLFPMQEMMVAPKKGNILVFPPTWMYPHSANRPESEDKYIISSFYHTAEEEGINGRA